MKFERIGLMSTNVLIPLALFRRVIELLEYWDINEKNDLRFEYCDVLWELKLKIQKLELREAYSKIISAGNEDARHDARIEYLRQRRRLGEVDVPEFPF
jgi:hypothetical protein